MGTYTSWLLVLLQTYPRLAFRFLPSLTSIGSFARITVLASVSSAESRSDEQMAILVSALEADGIVSERGIRIDSLRSGWRARLEVR